MSEDREDLLAKLDSQRAALLAELRGLSDKEAARPPAPGNWSAKQQLSHLARAERLYLACVRRVCDEEEPDLGVHWAEHQEEHPATANARPLEGLLADMESARQQTRQMVAALGDAEFGRVGRHTPFGDLTIGQLLRSLYRHDRMHADQVAGREPAYQPKFVNPPLDQRRPQ